MQVLRFRAPRLSASKTILKDLRNLKQHLHMLHAEPSAPIRHAPTQSLYLRAPSRYLIMFDDILPIVLLQNDRNGLRTVVRVLLSSDATIINLREPIAQHSLIKAELTLVYLPIKILPADRQLEGFYRL